MIVLRSAIMALALFTRIPMPTLAWERSNMRHILVALPFVGVIVAGLLQLWLWLSGLLGFGQALFACGLTLVPVLLTGGIHLDGYCDTVDALSSRGDTEKKLAILKDPHIGAFALIGVAAYLLAYFALACELTPSVTVVGLLGVAAVQSRAVGVFASIAFATARHSDLLSATRQGAGRPAAVVCALWFVAAGAVGFLLEWRIALAAALGALVALVYARVMSRRQFGGMSGDVAGFTIQMCEILALLALVLTEKVVVLL
ncbi:MAG: adenosylcobinamide-GDP ribazoletransferase [Coriobacteriales bacterium]|jgi:adenosylcobinamide-GDP ribazoletransferase|nr:adenosylcobinamide-GDP ribazoletransferase [Coriobacteriales bacterium]